MDAIRENNNTIVPLPGPLMVSNAEEATFSYFFIFFYRLGLGPDIKGIPSRRRANFPARWAIAELFFFFFGEQIATDTGESTQ